jgi:predicted RNA-binding protein with PUA-like domain
MSGKDGGIYAVGEITSNPEYLIDSEAESKYWFSDDDKEKKKLRVKFIYKTKLANNPLSRDEIKNVPELKNISIFKQPQGTNFPVTDEEWELLSKLIQNKVSG